jgi:hypothetical protein
MPYHRADPIEGILRFVQPPEILGILDTHHNFFPNPCLSPLAGTRTFVDTHFPHLIGGKKKSWTPIIFPQCMPAPLSAGTGTSVEHLWTPISRILSGGT